MKLNSDWGGGRAAEEGGRWEGGESQPAERPGAPCGWERSRGGRNRSENFGSVSLHKRWGAVEGLNIGEKSRSQLSF